MGDFGTGFQLIPVFRFEAPDAAFALLDTVREQQPVLVQILEFSVDGNDANLSLALLSGESVDIAVPSGVPVIEVESRILETMGYGEEVEERSLDKYMLHLMMPDGRLL